MTRINVYLHRQMEFKGVQPINIRSPQRTRVKYVVSKIMYNKTTQDTCSLLNTALSTVLKKLVYSFETFEKQE